MFCWLKTPTKTTFLNIYSKPYIIQAPTQLEFIFSPSQPEFSSGSIQQFNILFSPQKSVQYSQIKLLFSFRRPENDLTSKQSSFSGRSTSSIRSSRVSSPRSSRSSRSKESFLEFQLPIRISASANNQNISISRQKINFPLTFTFSFNIYKKNTNSKILSSKFVGIKLLFSMNFRRF
jgi:hypothetical protein